MRKLTRLLELTTELCEEGHRALVFSQFVRHLELVRRALDERGVHYQYLDGSTPQAERQRRVDAFQRGAGDLFLISLKAGGTGINLTGLRTAAVDAEFEEPVSEGGIVSLASRGSVTMPKRELAAPRPVNPNLTSTSTPAADAIGRDREGR